MKKNFYNSNLPFKALEHGLLILCIILISAAGGFAQTSWKGTTSTNWTTSSNWTNGVPTAAVDAIIGDANFTGSNQPRVNATATCKSLTIGTAAKVSTLTVASSITISGNFVIGNNGTINHSSSTTISLKGNWTNAGTTHYNATANNAVVTFSGSSQSLSGATTFRRMTINSGSTLTLSSAITANRTVTVNGILDPGTFLVTLNGNFVLNSGATIRVVSALYSGNYSRNPTSMSSSGIVDYSSSAVNQTVSNSMTYGTLRISGGMTKTLAGNLPSLSSGSATVGNVFVVAGTLNLSTFTANRGTNVAGGTFSVANGATLRIAGTNSFPSNYASRLLSTTSTVEYSGTNQTVTSLSYGNLTLSSSSGAAVKTMPASAMIIASNLVSTIGSGTSVSFTAGNGITVDGDVTIGASTTFNGGAFTHTVLGNWTNNGVFTGSGSKISMTGTNKIISGTGTHTFNNLEVLGSGGSIPGSVNLTVTGNLSTSGAGTLTHAAGGTLTMSGSGKSINGGGLSLNNVTITGSITNPSSMTIGGNFALSGTGTFTSTSGTITMSGSSKTISNTGSGSIAFAALSVSGSVTSSTGFSMSSDLSVTGTLTQTAGTVTFAGTSTFSGSANLFNVSLNGTKLELGGNAVLGIAGSFTITAGLFDVTTSNHNTVDYNAAGAQSILATTYHDLILSGSGTKSAAGGLTVNGDMMISGGATFAAGASTHTLYGNWTNDGSISAGASTIVFGGNVEAALSGSSVSTFNIVTLDKPSLNDMVTIGSDVVVATINMTSGRIQIPDTTKSLTITTTRTGNGTIIGKITRTHSFSNGVAYEFESPNTSVTFSGGGTNPGSVTMKVSLDGPADFVPPGTTVNRSWEINQSGGSGYTASISFHYEDAEVNGNAESLLHAWRYVGGAWVDSGKSLNDDIQNNLIKNGINDIIGRWTLQSKISGIVEWTGAVSNVWENAGNWNTVSGSPALPPDDSVYVRIGFSAFTNQPVVQSNAVIRSLSLGSSESVTLSLSGGSSLTINGSAGDLAGVFTSDVTHLVQVNDQSLSIGGNVSLSDGTMNRRINVSVGNGSILINGSLNHAGNSDISVSGSGVISIAGNWNRASGATFSPGAGTVVYNGNNDQTVMGGVAYNNLDISKSSGNAMLSSPTTVGGDLSIDSAGTFLLSATTLSVSGNVSVASGTRFDATSSALTVGGNWTSPGVFLPGAGTVTVNGAGTQMISGTEFSNLVVNKSAGSVTLTGNLVINGDLSITSGSVDLSSFTANRNSVGGTMSLGVAGAIRCGTGSGIPANFSAYALNAASTVEFYGTDPQIIPAINYGNLTLTNGGANAKTLAGAVTLAGDLVVNNGAALNVGSFPLTLSGSWTNNGTFNEGTGTVVLAGSTKTVTSPSNFNLNDLSVPGSYTLTSTQLHVLGNLNVTGSLDVGSTSSILDGDLTNQGTLQSNGTTTFTGTRVQTLRLVNAILSASTGVVNFNGTYQPILNSNSAPSFVTLNINNTAGIAPSIGWNVFGPFTIDSASSFIGGSFTHTFYGSVTNHGTMTSDGTLNFTPSTPKGISLLGNQFTSTGTVNFGGSGQLTITGANPSFSTVVISNTNGAGVTAPSSWNISSNFSIGAGAAFHAGSGLTHTIGGTFTNTGVFDGNSSTVVLNNAIDAAITGSGSTTFNNLTIAGVVSALSDFYVTADFTNDGTFDGTSADIYFSGNSPSTIGGSTSPTSLASFINVKIGTSTTLAIDLIDVVTLLDSTGALDLSSHTVTQDVLGGVLRVDDAATLKIGGADSLPLFNSYVLTPASTVEYNGTGVQIVSSAPVYGNLTLSNSGTKTAAGALTILGTLTITNGTFIGGNFTHLLAGDWAMTSGTFTSMGSTIAFNGTASQSISSIGAFANVAVNKSSGSLMAGSDVIVNGVLTLTSGNITTFSNKVIIGAAGSVSRTSGHIVGNLQKHVPTGSVSRTFEIGDSLDYTPADVSFNNVSGAGNLTASTTPGDHPALATSGIFPLRSVNRFWTITNSGVTFDNYQVNLTFVPGDIDSGASTANFDIRKYNSPNWSSTIAGTRTGTSTEATGGTSFSDFAVGEVATFTITGTAGANGTVSPPGPTVVAYGNSLQYTITPDSTYFVADVLVDGSSVGAVASYTFTNVLSNHTISATFSQIVNPAPRLFSVSPSSGYRGDTLHLTYRGLHFVNSVTTMPLIPGITSNGFTILSDTELVHDIVIGSNASLGSHGLYVHNVVPGGGYSDTLQFTVLNHMPGAVRLAIPVDADTLLMENLGSGVDFHWNRSLDPDVEDTVKYSIHIQGAGLDSTMVALTDTSLLWGLAGSLQLGAVYSWTVEASDGYATVVSPDTFTFYVTTLTAVKETKPGLPAVYALHQNFPNPFNPTTVIRFDLPQASDAKIAVYNIIGQLVESIVDQISMSAGYHEVSFDASKLPSGVYLYRIQAKEGSGKMYTSVKKMILVR